MKICIIGFGAAGIVAARYSSVDHECHIFERNDSLGGTWIYTEKTGNDHFGLPIHTSMYKNLRTNLPKELMGFSDFPMEGQGKSYMSAKEVYDFLNVYVEKFDLKKLVKFQHIATNVMVENEKWRVSVKNLVDNEVKDDIYDAVMVCNGHYHTPIYPVIPGMSTFPGYRIHSHDYRRPQDFNGKIVLVVGGGPSGIDISLDISSEARKIFLSCSSKDEKPQSIFLKNIEIVSQVEKIDGNRIFLQNDQTEEVDAIIFCTGYSYSFPFLDESCGIKVEENYVFPLYKHMLNINHPTMVFIGIPYRTIIFPMFEIQIKCFLSLLNDSSRIPTKENMLLDMKKREKIILERRLPLKRCHMIVDYIKTYFDDIAHLGGIDPLPDVIFKIFLQASISRKKNVLEYRKEVFQVIDSENFVSHF